MVSHQQDITQPAGIGTVSSHPHSGGRTDAIVFSSIAPVRRNRQAEGTFLRHAGRSFAVTAVSDAELNSVYQTVDVSVLLLKKRTLSGEELDEAALAH